MDFLFLIFYYFLSSCLIFYYSPFMKIFLLFKEGQNSILDSHCTRSKTKSYLGAGLDRTGFQEHPVSRLRSKTKPYLGAGLDRTGLMERFQGALEHQGFIIQIFDTSFQVQIKIFYTRNFRRSAPRLKRKKCQRKRIRKNIETNTSVYTRNIFKLCFCSC